MTLRPKHHFSAARSSIRRHVLATTTIGSLLTLSIAAVQPATNAPPSAWAHRSVAPLDCPRGGWTESSSITRTNDGRGGVDRLVQKSFSDLRICASAEDVEKGDIRPSDWSGRRLVLMSEERGGDLRRLEVVP